MPRAGQRNTLVRIERATETRSQTNNSVVKSWAKVADAWVSFMAPRGTEDFVDGARIEQIVLRLEGDYLELEGVKAEDRLIEVETGRIIDIKNVLPGRNFRSSTIIEGTQGPGAR
jgi:hypothetical protein